MMGQGPQKEAPAEVSASDTYSYTYLYSYSYTYSYFVGSSGRVLGRMWAVNSFN